MRTSIEYNAFIHSDRKFNGQDAIYVPEVVVYLFSLDDSSGVPLLAEPDFDVVSFLELGLSFQHMTTLELEGIVVKLLGCPQRGFVIVPSVHTLSWIPCIHNIHNPSLLI